MAPNKEEKYLPRGQDGLVSQAQQEMQATPREYHIVYYKVLCATYWHIGGLYGLFLCCTSANYATILLNCIIYLVGNWGMTSGAEYLWLRRSYKAKMPLQIILMLFQSLSCQGSVIQWVRDMRLQRNYRDTDADPFNSKRGYFYSHFGWQVVKRHDDVIKKGKELDLSHVNDNPVLQFEDKYYLLLSSLLVFILPSLISVYFFQETLKNAYHVCLFHFIVGFYTSFAANSATNSVNPTGKSALGSYDNTSERHFPFQYRSCELFQSPLSTKLIDIFARIGWAYDLNVHTSGKSKSSNSWSRDDEDVVESHKNFIGF